MCDVDADSKNSRGVPGFHPWMKYLRYVITWYRPNFVLTLFSENFHRPPSLFDALFNIHWSRQMSWHLFLRLWRNSMRNLLRRRTERERGRGEVRLEPINDIEIFLLAEIISKAFASCNWDVYIIYRADFSHPDICDVTAPCVHHRSPRHSALFQFHRVDTMKRKRWVWYPSLFITRGISSVFSANGHDQTGKNDGLFFSFLFRSSFLQRGGVRGLLGRQF